MEVHGEQSTSRGAGILTNRVVSTEVEERRVRHRTGLEVRRGRGVGATVGVQRRVLDPPRMAGGDAEDPVESTPKIRSGHPSRETPAVSSQHLGYGVMGIRWTVSGKARLGVKEQRLCPRSPNDVIWVRGGRTTSAGSRGAGLPRYVSVPPVLSTPVVVEPGPRAGDVPPRKPLQ